MCMIIHSQIKETKMESVDMYMTVDHNHHEVLQTKVTAGNLFKFLLFIFMLAWTILLTSCMVTVPVPRHPPRGGVMIEMNDYGGHHDNGNHHDRTN